MDESDSVGRQDGTNRAMPDNAKSTFAQPKRHPIFADKKAYHLILAATIGPSLLRSHEPLSKVNDVPSDLTRCLCFLKMVAEFVAIRAGYIV
jgi:hypothetical protein